MTTKKQLKARIRARMAATGERYLTARRHLAGEPADAPTVDSGYTLRGGTHPDSAAVANLLFHLGVRPGGSTLSEAMVFGISGGLGAGYILWEFQAHRDGSHLVLGYHNDWQYQIRWLESTLERLGIAAELHRTGGAKGAAARLTRALGEGRPVIVLPDRYLMGYWRLPPHLEAHGGHPVVAYAETGGRVHIDDRNLRPLTVERTTLDAARARVVSYKNLLIEAGPATDIDLTAAVHQGLRACVEQLTSTSDSFSLPAWRKWARLMTDTKHAKGWPTVFADGHGLTGALLSTWEGIEPAGMSGGNLRLLYADFLVEAGELLGVPELAALAPDWTEADRAWHAVAEVALPADVAPYGEMRELTAAVTGGITEDGDAAAEQVAEASQRLWELRAEYADKAPHADFAAIGAALMEVYEKETAAARRLSDVVGRLTAA